MAFVLVHSKLAARNLAWAATLILALSIAPSEANADAGGRRSASFDVGPARGFTINEMLASREAGRPDATRQVATIERSGKATDGSRELAPLGRRDGPEPFGQYALRAPEGQLWVKWRAMEMDLAEEAKAISGCAVDPKNCTVDARRYFLIVEETKKRQGRARLETANRLLNRAIRYTPDDSQHGVPDRWTAPLASLVAERGDCEDFAIAKYAVLRAAGVAEADMRLVLVRDTAARLDHAVLAVLFEGRWLVLDNRHTMTVEAEELRHYMPLFALDHEGVKLFAAAYASWGDGHGIFAEWTLRGSDAADFGAWELRGSDVEPAAAN